jgi:hypothetical protein
MVLLVPKAIFMLVFLNRLVMKLVSFPMHVKVAHFGVGVCVCVVINCFLLVSVSACGLGVDWEAVVLQDVLDGGNLCVVEVFM